MKAPITVGHITKVTELTKRVKQLGKRAAYVGIPEATSKDRAAQLLRLAAKAGKGKRKKLLNAATQQVTNAQLLWIFSKGSSLRNQPARPVLEPSIEAAGNKEAIANELAGLIKARLAGNDAAVTEALKRTAMAGQNAARAWFTDKRNGWQKNAQSTIDAKGSDRPGIDTGAMLNAIEGVYEADQSSAALTKA